MKSIFIVFVFLVIQNNLLNAQISKERLEKRPVKNVNFNFVGDASHFSLNFERQYLIHQNFIISQKIGIGYNEKFQVCLFGHCDDFIRYLTIPHHVSMNVGKSRHFLEMGIGGTFLYGNTTQPYLVYPILGYRFLPIEKDNVNFRIFTHLPFTGKYAEDILFIPFGISLGVSF
jgi:hypothetical protein